MKIKRIKTFKVNCYEFDVVWEKDNCAARFSYEDRKLYIGVQNVPEEELLHLLTHELLEICAIEMHVRYGRPDCFGDYLFSYDHRQHSTLAAMLAGCLTQFLL